MRQAEAHRLPKVSHEWYHLLGLSTRRIETLVRAPVIEELSKFQISAMAAEFDAQVEGFRGRPMDAAPTPLQQTADLTFIGSSLRMK